ncbi:hypothetical protein K469DRAFT_307922 [Zopfia rhizophila CBS 207.26]|uniref:Uncharacterized protein n=1 Tax=Zopfia rhizophila CBS 207.26 TaxID=1314779 RepID=A0A6A6EM82_9PEZI|nr:hypothetical protein K469DRAFT_307922 [Zopfia rhizophila CBS 207.26]
MSEQVVAIVSFLFCCRFPLVFNYYCRFGVLVLATCFHSCTYYTGRFLNCVLPQFSLFVPPFLFFCVFLTWKLLVRKKRGFVVIRTHGHFCSRTARLVSGNCPKSYDGVGIMTRQIGMSLRP